MRGKDSDKGQGRCIPEDHPRLCGEKAYYVYHAWADSGSPPPMRGKATSGNSRVYQHRITPAYAGKRSGIRSGKLAF